MPSVKDDDYSLCWTPDEEHLFGVQLLEQIQIKWKRFQLLQCFCNYSGNYFASVGLDYYAELRVVSFKVGDKSLYITHWCLQFYTRT